MSKLSKEKKDKLILICLMIVGVLGVLYTFVLGAQQDKLNTYQTQLSSVQDRITKAERLIKSGPIVEENLAENRKTLETMEKEMSPQGQYYYWFLKLLEDFRTKERLDQNFLADLKQPEPADAALLPKFPYKALTFGVRTNGRYHDIGRFISDFENAFPYMRIERIRLQPDTGTRLARPRSVPGALGQPVAEPEPVAGASEKLLGDILIVTFIRPSAT
jgi:Tfp pilus assembly protein PilO